MEEAVFPAHTNQIYHVLHHFLISSLLLRKKNSEKYQRKPNAIFLYAVNQATKEQSEQVQDPPGEGKASNDVGESNYSYAAVPASEQNHNQADSVALIEHTIQQHKQKGIKQPVPVPRKQISKPAESSADRVYAPVSKPNMMSPNVAEANATFDESSEEALAESVHIRLPPSLSSNGETH